MNTPESAGRADRALPALATAAAAFVVPWALSASSTPSPDHAATYRWYRSLRKPWFKPKDSAIPLVWIALEAALAFSAYRLIRSKPSPERTRALSWWSANIAMIGLWSRLFFKRHQLGASTAAAAAMVVGGVEYVRQAQRVDKVAARVAVPYIAWLSFATVLAATIWSLNRQPSRDRR